MAKYAANRTQVFFGSANPPTTEVLNLRDVNFNPGQRVPPYNVDDHNNSTGTVLYQSANKVETAELSFEIMLDPADAVHLDMYTTLHTNPSPVRYAKYVRPDAGNQTTVGPCEVQSFEENAPVNGILTASVKIKFLSAITTTP